MAPKLVVKNTFICAVEEDEPTTPTDEFQPRRRAQTSPDPRSLSQELQALELESLDDEEADLHKAPEMDPETEGARGVAAGVDTKMEALKSDADRGVAMPLAVEDHSDLLPREVQASSANSAETPVTSATSSATTLTEPIPAAELQRRLAVSSPTEARLIADDLRGKVMDAARSPQAHLVLLELIRRLSTEDAAFIPAELCGHGRHIASNIYGHAVVCRLLEFSAEHPMTVRLLDEVLSSGIESLCCHKFGFSLAISVLSNGPQHQKGRVVAALSTHVQRFARHRFASQVLEHAILDQHESRDCERLVSELLRHGGGVTKLACHCFGTHVVRALLSVPAAAKQVRAVISGAEQKLRKDRYGAKLLEDLAQEQQGPVSQLRAMSLFGA